MESDNESFNLEGLPMILNCVLEKAELICRDENVYSSGVFTFCFPFSSFFCFF